MQIVVTRVDVHRYSTITERNGVQLRVPGYGFMRALPHDLAHFVVEGSLGLDQGFWGSVADGAEFAGMEKIKGRRQIGATRPFAREGGEQSGPRPRRNARAVKCRATGIPAPQPRSSTRAHACSEANLVNSESQRSRTDDEL
jgi:hypothetical protein